MTEHVAAFAPDSLPITEYVRVNAEQLDHIQRAMELPEHQANFEIMPLPVETEEQRWTAAVEWAANLEARGQVRAREMGAAVVISSRDESPLQLMRQLEDKVDEVESNFVTHALLRVAKLDREADFLDLLKTYYKY